MKFGIAYSYEARGKMKIIIFFLIVAVVLLSTFIYIIMKSLKRERDDRKKVVEASVALLAFSIEGIGGHTYNRTSYVEALDYVKHCLMPSILKEEIWDPDFTYLDERVRAELYTKLGDIYNVEVRPTLRMRRMESVVGKNRKTCHNVTQK